MLASTIMATTKINHENDMDAQRVILDKEIDHEEKFSRVTQIQILNLPTELNDPMEALRKKASQQKASQYEPEETPNLGIGQPNIPYPSIIADALTRLIPTTLPYSLAQGLPETREAVARYVNRMFLTNYDSSQILITNGATGALYLAYQAFLKHNDAVAIFEGSYSGYVSALNQLQRALQLIVVPTEENFRPSIDAMREALLTYPHIKLVIYSSPANPTGVVFSKDEVIKLQQFCVQFPDILFILDLVYWSLIHNGSFYSLLSSLECQQNTILIDSLSKSFSVPGLRAGFLVAPQHNMAERLATIQANMNAGIPEPVERVMKVIYTAKYAQLSQNITTETESHVKALTEWEIQAKTIYQSNVQYMQKELTKLGLPTPLPEGGFFVFPNVASLIGLNIPGKPGERFKNSDEVAQYLLVKKAAITVPGSAFHLDSTKHHLRMCCTASRETLKQAIEKIRVALVEVKSINSCLHTPLRAHSIWALKATNTSAEAVLMQKETPKTTLH